MAAFVICHCGERDEAARILVPVGSRSIIMYLSADDEDRVGGEREEALGEVEVEGKVERAARVVCSRGSGSEVNV